MASTIFELTEFQPYQHMYLNKLTELERRKSYYDGSVFDPDSMAPKWLQPRLYKNIKPLYLPLSRAVDVDAGIIPGGWALPEEGEQYQEAIDTVFGWSGWATQGVLYVHYGAMYGVSALKVVDARLAEPPRVIIQPVKPSCLLVIPGNQYDSTPMMSVWIEKWLDEEGKPFEYAEVIDAQSVRIYKDAIPWSPVEDREPEYANELGFVPYVEIEHIKTGEPYGESTYQKAMPLLEQVNEIGAYLGDIIKKHAEPQWAISGAQDSDLIKSGDNVWFLPDGGNVVPVVAGIDIPGVLEFVRELRDQVHGALPELAFDELSKKDQIATATLELQLMELVLKIKRSRPNYDDGLARALRMAAQAAATMEGVPVDISVLDSDGLMFDGERDVLPPDQETLMRLEMQAIALERERGMAIGEGLDDG